MALTSTTVPWLDFADGTLRRSVPGVFQLVHRLRRAAVGLFCLDGANIQTRGCLRIYRMLMC